MDYATKVCVLTSVSVWTTMLFVYWWQLRWYRWQMNTAVHLFILLNIIYVTLWCARLLNTYHHVKNWNFGKFHRKPKFYWLLNSGNPEISSGGVKKWKKSKIPQLFQDIALDKVFIEKLLWVRLDFYFRRTATKSVWIGRSHIGLHGVHTIR